MSDERHPDQHKGGKDQYKRHVDGDIRVSGQVEVHPPPSLAKEDETDRKDQRTSRNKNFIVSLLTLIAVVIYAGITFWQGRMTRESIDNNSRQFQIDQRPYLWDTNTTPQIDIEAGKRMWVNIEMVDFGKSPALKVKIAGKIFVGPTAKADAYQWFEVLGNKPLTDPEQSETVVMPGIPSVFPPKLKEEANKSVDGKPKAISLGGFGGGGFFTLWSDGVLIQSDVDYILNTEESAVVVARLQYFDSFGNRHWSDLCMSRFTNGNIPHCARHNEVR